MTPRASNEREERHKAIHDAVHKPVTDLLAPHVKVEPIDGVVKFANVKPATAKPSAAAPAAASASAPLPPPPSSTAGAEVEPAGAEGDADGDGDGEGDGSAAGSGDAVQDRRRAKKQAKAAKAKAKADGKGSAAGRATGAAAAGAAHEVSRSEWPDKSVEEACKWTRLAMAENAASIRSQLRLSPLPDLPGTRPVGLAAVAREVCDLPMGLRLDVVLTKASALTSDAALHRVLLAACTAASIEQSRAAALVPVLRSMLAAMAPEELERAAAEVGSVTLLVDGLRVTLVFGKDVFLDGAGLARAEGIADAWATAGWADLGEAYARLSE